MPAFTERVSLVSTIIEQQFWIPFAPPAFTIKNLRKLLLEGSGLPKAFSYGIHPFPTGVHHRCSKALKFRRQMPNTEARCIHLKDLHPYPNIDETQPFGRSPDLARRPAHKNFRRGCSNSVKLGRAKALKATLVGANL